MGILPEIKKCPCCDTVNFVIVEGISIENKFKNLKNWKFKKQFCCRKCKEELGLFIRNGANRKKEEKLVWLNNLNVEEHYYKTLDLLKKKKSSLSKVKNKEEEYFHTVKNIEDIEERIRLEKVKLKIKFKIQNKSILKV